MLSSEMTRSPFYLFIENLIHSTPSIYSKAREESQLS
jgi:hypothetical protein